MKAEDVLKLALAYAVSRPADELPADPGFAERVVRDFLLWLMKDYCIVPKNDLARANKDSELCKLPIWTWYVDGARTMLLRLRDFNLCAEPSWDTGIKKEKSIYNKATLDLIMESLDNVDTFISLDFENIGFTNHKRDKKGKVKSCRAHFIKGH